ncbi:winged helix-turn-helix transcriptional regulator [Muricauda ruestringensis]|uniref:Winged helix-turn-helix transcriptional regulator n=1 Tax=Flagellimonas aurea TaxID=2915619 RepID=A0ABS3G4U3_9FLAO|nr:winged helix-turn-helix transcriptional regulator [Allomuricauda aurea]MBO0353891.1 winged helix-turn-helix transcriptional regulator [Allomuricauda aurea]
MAKIMSRILSKEVKEHRMNDLVERKVNETRPINVEYSLPLYCKTLDSVINSMLDRGIQHRKNILAK